MMQPICRWWRFALAPLAVATAVAVSVPEYVFAQQAPVRGNQETARREYERGAAHYQQRDFSQAVTAFTRAIAADPANPHLYSARANAYTYLGNSRMAQMDHQRARAYAGGPGRVPQPNTQNGARGFTGNWTSNYQPEPEEPESLPMPGATVDESPSLDAPQALSPESLSSDSSISLAGLLAARVTAASQNVGAPSTSVTPQDASYLIPQSTGELLQSAPSINTRRTSAINLDPRIRGFNPAQINASADGMTQIKSRQDIDSLFSNIDPAIVRNVDVIDGPYTSLYGLGYGFLIADLYPTQRSAAPEFHGSTLFSQDTNGRNLHARQTVFGSGVDWGFYATSGIRTGNDYRPGSGSQDFRIPASYRKWDNFLSLSLDLTETSRIEASYLRTELNNAELAGVVYDINYAQNEQFNVRYVVQEDPNGPEQAVVQYWWNRTPFHGDSTRDAQQRTFTNSFIRNNFFGNAFDNSVIGLPVFNPDFDIANTFVHGATQSTGTRAYRTWGDFNEPQLTAGVDYRRNTIQYREVNLNFLGVNAFGPASVFGIPYSSQEEYGAFTNFAVPVTEDVTLTVGGRVNASRSFVDTTDDAFFVGTGTGRPNEIMGMAYATGRVQLTDALSTNLGVAYGQRNPNLTELYAGQPFVPLVRYGNSFVTGDSELTPERNLQFDLGFTGEWENFVFTARSYYANIDNYILYFVDGTGDSSFVGAGPFTSLSYQYTNLDRASLYGGDAFAEARLLSWLSANGSVYYTRGTNHSPVGKGAEGLPNIFPLEGRLGFRVHDRCDERWSVGLITRMVHGQDFVADSLGELPTPGFTIFNVRGYYRVTDNLRLTGAVENLFDRIYTQHGSLVINDVNGNLSFVKEPGLNFLMGMELSY